MTTALYDPHFSSQNDDDTDILRPYMNTRRIDPKIDKIWAQTEFGACEPKSLEDWVPQRDGQN